MLKSSGALSPFSVASLYEAPPSGRFPPTAGTSGEVRAGSLLALPLSEESSSGGRRERVEGGGEEGMEREIKMQRDAHGGDEMSGRLPSFSMNVGLFTTAAVAISVLV